MEADHGAAALTRLALSDKVRDLIDDAMQLIPTLDDHAGSPASHLDQALRLRAQANAVVRAAILNARAQGLGWADIAVYTGIKTASVRQRWELEERHWRNIVQRARGAGQPRPNDPHVVFAPKAYAEDLDSWTTRHLDDLRMQRWAAEGKDASRTVSGGLPPTFPGPAPR